MIKTNHIFMKKLRNLLGVLVAASSAMSVSAQVDNYAVRFTSGEGIVNLGNVSAFQSADDYTLQLWFCPESWTQGASIIRSGRFSIKLGVNHAIVLNDGTNHLAITSSEIAAGKWTHLTIRSSAAGTRVTVNGEAEYTLGSVLELPADTKSLWLGGDFIGRVDEVRLWNGELPADYNSFTRTTLNELNPSWKSLAAYWKMDQEQCANLVDYRGDAHGTFSASGVEKSKVTDNDKFRYLINLAYGNVERFFDRAVDKRHYSLSNRIALIGGAINTSDATISPRLTRYDADLGDAKVTDFGTKKGVVVLDGTTQLTLPKGVLGSAPENFAFESWVYVDEWVEGATLFKKNAKFNVTLGAEGILVINGVEAKTSVPVGKWVHIGICNTSSGFDVLVGSKVTSVSVDTHTLTSSSVKPVIGTGFKGKFEEIMIWKGARTTDQMKSDASQLPLADNKVTVAGNLWNSMDACYLFDNAEEPGFDSFSLNRIYRTMREYNAGMRGVKYVVTISAGSFDNCFSNASNRTKLAKALAEIGNDPDFDGIDFDFEWTYSAGGWNNIALICQETRKLLQEGKELTVTPHAVTYAFPVDKMDCVDRFYFQIYGPGQTPIFTMPYYTARAEDFVNHGYPKDKIVMSYATTTSGGWTSATGGSRVGSSHPGFYPAGYKGIYNSTVRPSDDVIYNSANDCYYYLTGFDQTIERTQYTVENDLGGIMYWDLGNDLASTHKYSLARGASYALNSNVELLVTEVDSAAPAPENDPNGPEATDDPADQGGFDTSLNEEAILAALQVYANTPGYPGEGSTERANLLNAINLAKLGLSDAASLNKAVEAYLASSPSAVGAPLDGVRYYVYGVNRYEENAARFLAADANGLTITATRPANLSADYQWTVTAAGNGFTLCNNNGKYLSADGSMTADAAKARVFPVVAGNSMGQLQLQMSDTDYLVSHYEETTRVNMAVDITTDANAEGNNPKLWSSQWVFEPVEEPVSSLVEYTVLTDGGSTGLVIGDGDIVGNGSTIYYDGNIGVTTYCENSTNASVAIDEKNHTISLAPSGLQLNRVYRFSNKEQGSKYLTIDEDKKLVVASMDSDNPQQMFKIARVGANKFVLTAQGVYLDEPANRTGQQNGTSSTPAVYYVLMSPDGTFAFDGGRPYGGSWDLGSRTLSAQTNAKVQTGDSEAGSAWWTAEEVDEVTVPAVAAGNEYYAAVALPFAMEAPDKVYTAHAREEKLYLTALEGSIIPAGLPVLIKADAESVTLRFAAEEAEVPRDVTNHLKGYFFAGDAPAAAFRLGDHNGTPAFIANRPSEGRNRAYVESSRSNSSWLKITDEVDAISEITTGTDNSGTIYDLQGRKVTSPKRGIYIVNGRKVVF